MANQKVQLKSNGNNLYPIGILNGIDTSNILRSGSNQQWTCTQDGILKARVSANSSHVYIDGVQVSYASNSYHVGEFIYPIKKGQIIKCVDVYTVYGIKQ